MYRPVYVISRLAKLMSQLAELPALEILDLSKNQLTTLPESPGRLAALKVLSLSDNHIVTLPTYLIAFERLKVFKVDLNPIQWPPREVLGLLAESDPKGRHDPSNKDRPKRDEDLRPWIQNMKRWLQEQIGDSSRFSERDRGRTQVAEDEMYLASE